MRAIRHSLFLAAFAACASSSTEPGADECWESGKCDAARSGHHVQLIHVDGFRPDLFKALLEGDQLPHFKILVGQGKVSYEAATVDKTETMKVIQSYLTS